MPRPKRTRVAATRPTKAASPAEVQSSATPPIVAKPAAAQAEFPGSDIYDVSDREKERVRERAAEAAKTDRRTSRRTRASQHLDLDSEQTRVLEDSSRRANDALNRLDDLSSTSRPAQTESPDIEHSRRDSVGIQPRLTDVSGLDLDDELFANLDDSLDNTESAIGETQSGYRSTDTSSFNVAMFKRRPRQSSVAGREEAIRPSSRGQNTPSISTTLNFSNFRRRAREPSILGTARKPRTQRSVSRASQASRNASVLGDGDDSGPDGESTPLDRTRRQTRASLADGSRNGSPELPTRKRKSLESHQDGREKRTAVEAEMDEGENEAEEIHQSIEIEVERTPSPARGRALERDRFSTPVQDPDDPDMAPPMSSSSEGDSPAAWPALDSLAHRTYARRPPPRAAKTPELHDCSSDLSSPPSLTHSPNYAAAAKAVAKKKAAPPQKKVTTADLTSLLPRRRHKASTRTSDTNDPFDLDASDDDAAAANNEDELSYVDSRAARRRKAQPLSKSTSNRKGKAPDTSNGAGKKRALRTYGAQEDKENDEVEVEDEIVVGSGGEEGGEDESEELPVEETSQIMRERLGEELQKAVKKFKEVDQWELSFEEVTQSSSPGPDAR